MSFHDFTVKRSDGTDLPLSEYRGKVVLVVNTASRCGFTPQYEGLQKLYREYRERGFEILAFPCNQFGGQEPGVDAEIQEFCRLEYGVEFPVLAKIEVNGSGTAPLFEWLKRLAPGLLGTETIKWNFTKFLVSREGLPLRRFAPQDRPEALREEIERALSS